MLMSVARPRAFVNREALIPEAGPSLRYGIGWREGGEFFSPLPPAAQMAFGCLIPNLMEASEHMSNQSNSPQPDIDPLLKVREAAKMLSISVPSFWRRVADGSVPKPIKLGSSSRWLRSEILAVIEEAKARRQDARV